MMLLQWPAFVTRIGQVFNLEETKLLKPGESWDLAGYTLEYRQAQPLSHPHYAGAIARVAVRERGEPVGILLPEKRMYFQQETPTTIPAVASTLREDLYRRVWGGELPTGDRCVDVYVRKLRAKLAEALPDWSFIHTHVGFGYRLEPELSQPFHTTDTQR